MPSSPVSAIDAVLSFSSTLDENEAPLLRTERALTFLLRSSSAVAHSGDPGFPAPPSR